jgi:hypothetical protein
MATLSIQTDTSHFQATHQKRNKVTPHDIPLALVIVVEHALGMTHGRMLIFVRLMESLR